MYSKENLEISKTLFATALGVTADALTYIKLLEDENKILKKELGMVKREETKMKLSYIPAKWTSWTTVGYRTRWACLSGVSRK